jgi:hypothetical protein
MASQGLGGFDPLVVVFDGLLALCFIRLAKVAFVVAHDEDIGNALAAGDFLEFGDVGSVFRFVLPELIDVLNGIDAKFGFSDAGEVEVSQLLCEERFVKRPFGEGDLEKRRLCLSESCVTGGERGRGRGC